MPVLLAARALKADCVLVLPLGRILHMFHYILYSKHKMPPSSILQNKLVNLGDLLFTLLHSYSKRRAQEGKVRALFQSLEIS